MQPQVLIEGSHKQHRNSPSQVNKCSAVKALSETNNSAESSPFSAATLLVGWQERHPAWVLAVTILTGALHDLQLQLSPPPSSTS